jgi:hypothetical protein
MLATLTARETGVVAGTWAMERVPEVMASEVDEVMAVEVMVAAGWGLGRS